MSDTSIEQLRAQLDRLAQTQARRRDGNGLKAAYRLSIEDAPCAYGAPKQAVCTLLQPEPGPSSGSGCTSSLTEDVSQAYSWPVPASAKSTLKAGRQAFADADDFESHLDAMLEQAAFSRLASKLAARDRSSHEVVGLLIKEGYDASVAQRAVGRACRCNLIDDSRFAQSFVSAKRRAGWGSRRIEHELSLRGVPDTDVQKALADLDAGESEFERAIGVARKKRLSDTNPTEKLARFLVGRGFGSDIALRAARQAVSEASQEMVSTSG